MSEAELVAGAFNPLGTLGDRTRERREQLGLSQGELGQRVGVSQQAIDQLESGATKRPRYVADLARELDVSIEWLQGKTEERGQGYLPQFLNPSTPTTTSRIPEVDVRGGMGGGGVVALEVNHVDEWGNSMAADNVRATWELPNDYLRHELRVAPAKAYLIEVRGDSMSPTLETGDRVMIDTADTVPAPGGVFALFDGLGVVVKRLEHVPMSDPPIIKIISDNPHHGIYERTLEEIRIIGRAIWFGRRM
ncbi:putative Repressor protein CI [uncultured Alphaproteobacteria bacterium]|uniref:Putative Repressor protein CI n=1 Tax=uncultured Alphaproteobacteria bacterium TaxID=91750 RepID=A0A212J3K8_9PROT|nr:putative Repressor protein CI [uncultured Alphaproteobacteria bacterium]